MKIRLSKKSKPSSALFNYLEFVITNDYKNEKIDYELYTEMINYLNRNRKNGY